ncbi:MAG: pyridoxamine 5'-phosphate oxidase family protein [Gammaproteobacteria bacterium]|nr:pyridoxamine 5'-phosphate oxidase family protein [Gammaproteobacteria bacterium]
MSRREQIQLTEEEIRDFLQSSRTIILVSNGKNGFPHPMPMWYLQDEEGRILMTTFRKSQKILNLKRDPRVTLLVESGDVYTELKSVLIKAEAEIIDDLETTIDTMFKLSVHRGEASSDQEEVMKNGLRNGVGRKRVVMRFKPLSIVSWDHKKLAGVY